jgi:hypothetical protein
MLDKVPEGEKERLEWLGKWRTFAVDEDSRMALEKWYGKDRATLATHTETFEICEYGRQPDKEEILNIFPMLKK